MPKVLKFRMTCPECHEVITGQAEAPVVADNRVQELLGYWQVKHMKVCPSHTMSTPRLEGTELYGEYGQDEAEFPNRTIVTAR